MTYKQLSTYAPHVHEFFRVHCAGLPELADAYVTGHSVEWATGAVLTDGGIAVAGMVDGTLFGATVWIDATGIPLRIGVYCGCRQGSRGCEHLHPAFTHIAAAYRAEGAKALLGTFPTIEEFKREAIRSFSALSASLVVMTAEVENRRGPADKLSLPEGARPVAVLKEGRLVSLEPGVLIGGETPSIKRTTLSAMLQSDNREARRVAALVYAAQEAAESVNYLRAEGEPDRGANASARLGSLRELADLDLLVQEDGRPVRFEPEAAAMLRWRPLSPEKQRLEMVVADGSWDECEVAYLDREASVLYGNKLGRPFVDAALAWPPLFNGQVEEVAETITRAGLQAPIPSVVDIGPVEQISARWVVVIQPDPANSNRVLFDLVAQAEGLELGRDIDCGGLHHVDGRWVSLSLPPRPQAQFERVASVHAFSQDARAVGTTPDLLVWTVHDLQQAFEGEGFVVDVRGVPPVRVVSHKKGRTLPGPEITVGRQDEDGLHPLSATWAVDGHPVDAERALRFEMLQRAQAVQGEPWLSRQLKSGLGPDNTVEIGEGVYLKTSAGHWAKAWLPQIHLYATANKQGKQPRANRAAVMAALLGGATLKFEDAADDPRTTLTHLLAAKEGEGIASAPGVLIDYLPFQRQGLQWLLTLRQVGCSGILADDRGTGKTLESLGAGLLHRASSFPSGRQDGAAEVVRRPPVVVVVERRDVQTWRNELADKVTGVDWIWHQGPKRPKRVEDLRGFDLILTTYGVLSRDIALFLELSPEMVFLDEANSLKSPTSAKSRDVSRLDGATLIPITGTPVDHNPRHLHALINVAMPGLLGRAEHFASLQKLIAKHPDTALAKAERQRVAAVIAPFLLRRTRQQLKEQFPAKRELPVEITLDRSDAATYRLFQERIHDDYLAVLEERGLSGGRFQINALLDKLRRWCARVGTARQMTAKGEYVLDVVREHLEAGDKVVVFSHFNSEVVALTELLRGKGINAGRWVGEDAPAVRDREYKLFKAGHTDVLVIGAYGARGLDLPEARACIIADPWIDVTTDDQMGDRVHRIISKEGVTIYRLALAGTIEQVALEMAMHMTKASEGVLTGQVPESGGSSTLHREDFDRMFTALPDDVAE